jgi:murein DD-endopeptidase MepM/ murein hydrolase activator NlpD
VKRLAIVALAVLLNVLLSLSVAPLIAQDTPPPTAVPLPTRQPRPAPSSSVTVNNATLQLFFATLPQGTTGLMRVSPNNGMSIGSVRAFFLRDTIDFFPAEDGFYGLIAADMEQQTSRTNTLTAYVTYTDGSRDTVEANIEIPIGAFIRQEVTLAPDKAYLMDIETERNELAQLEGIFSTYTEQKMWDETGFQFPLTTTLTSPFGAFRTFNGTLNTRHTGWDLTAITGTPIMASAAGRVAFAGMLPVRGNHVVIDHGFGVFTTYSHMSVVHVTRGETVAKGQIIGEVGETGRTSGPHFHWEVAVNDHFVDGSLFLQMWTP